MSRRRDWRVGRAVRGALAAGAMWGGTAAGQPCVSGAWTLLDAPGPGARGKHAMTFDAGRGRLVLFGGFDGSHRGDTWEWVGSAWSLVAASGPSARQSPAMAYDSRRVRTLLFGGNGSGQPYLGDTWEWNGAAWTIRSSGGGPSGRYSHAMVYDSLRERAVLFGGYDGALKGDTWEWDGSAWTMRSSPPQSGPSARYMHAMVYDAARARVVLFGGYDGSLKGDTWEWDGSAWTLRSPGGGPSARSGHAMAYDATRSRTTLFGGHDGAYRADVWEWDGASWTLRSAGGGGPGPRTVGAVAYDGVRRRDMLFGGITGGSGPTYTYASDTWERGDQTPAIVQQPAGAAVTAGQAATFTVAVAGAGPMSFQWRRGGSVLADGGRRSGTATPTLTINPVMLGVDAGTYDVVVSNACGSVVSAAAVLTVLCRPDWDGNARLEPQDVSGFLGVWYSSVSFGTPSPLAGDFDRNLRVEPADVSSFVSAWMAGLGGSCPP